MQQISNFVDNYLSNLHIPTIIRWTDFVEVIIISFVVYQVLIWIRETRAWNLLKGIIMILAFLALATIFNMTTILWIAQRVFSLAVIAVVVVLQPELRRALEALGRKNLVASIFPIDNLRQVEEGRFSDKTINEITKACIEMGRAKTGALIVIEQNQSLAEYERTGIDVDAILTSQLLINIFEHNTPLHDGAIIVRGNRITSATCYLPLSDNMALSKELGTRHRAGVGISEVTDSMTVIVSEETGKISIAYDGKIERGMDADRLKERLESIQNKPTEEKKGILWRGRLRNEKETDK
ncbi:MAG: diadenylate cyclase CdaA [Lachnospiraceae bacterium]|nr:diadenylate cyclase CdaA [Lachnospiraceae bacterium]